MSTTAFNQPNEINQIPQQFQQPTPPRTRSPLPPPPRPETINTTSTQEQPFQQHDSSSYQTQLLPSQSSQTQYGTIGNLNQFNSPPPPILPVPVPNTSTSTSNNIPPSTASNDKLQLNLNKIQAQLNSKGGKYGVWASNQLQLQADAIKKIPIVGDINTGGQATLYHVFKSGGLFSKDDLVTLEDRNSPAYYLEFPRSYRNSWNLTLHSHSQQGPIIANLTKGSYGFTMHDIEINMSNGFKTILTKPSLISKNHQFIGLDGITIFKWRRDGMLSSTMTLQDLSNGKVAATWEHSYAFGKDGKLFISPSYNFMIDLLIASALAMEEWRREEEEKSSRTGGAGGGGVSSSMGLLKMGLAGLKKFK